MSAMPDRFTLRSYPRRQAGKSLSRPGRSDLFDCRKSVRARFWRQRRPTQGGREVEFQARCRRGDAAPARRALVNGEVAFHRRLAARPSWWPLDALRARPHPRPRRRLRCRAGARGEHAAAGHGQLSLRLTGPSGSDGSAASIRRAKELPPRTCSRRSPAQSPGCTRVLAAVPSCGSRPQRLSCGPRPPPPELAPAGRVRRRAAATAPHRLAQYRVAPTKLCCLGGCPSRQANAVQHSPRRTLLIQSAQSPDQWNGGSDSACRSSGDPHACVKPRGSGKAAGRATPRPPPRRA